MGALYIAGSLNMDVVAFANRLPLPGETISGSKVGFFPGGKGLNPAVAAARQGADVRLIGKLGIDGFGDDLYRFAEDNGIDLSCVGRTEAAATGTAIIMVAETGENSIVVIPGTNGLLTAEESAAPPFQPDDVLLTLFEIDQSTVHAFLNAGRNVGAKTILSPSPAAPFTFRALPDILVLNETELAYYLDQDLANANIEELEEATSQFRSRRDQTIILTLGAQGSLALTPQGTIRVPGRRVEAADTTGAGDCFTGNLAAQLAAGVNLEEAIRFANVAASISVTRPGAAPSMPIHSEVMAVLEESE